MSDYTQTTDFSAKDALTTGDAEKAISGADVDGEFSAIATAVATKIDKPGSPATNDFLSWTGSSWDETVPATKADMETGTSATAPVVVARVNDAAGVAKGWAKFDAAGTVEASHNVTSVADNGTGDFTVTWATDFSSADYAVAATAFHSSFRMAMVSAQAAGTTQVLIKNTAGSNADPTSVYVVAFGDQ